ncbi:MAG: Unknown protein [uncultured Sulfurovum sp.]|uniref:Uncharacterized protein n=1 Tax=uncultured Sulfurovum sp. TaxID=269237 RepID=A0A6S6SEF3_9BACT|nr:MAG: Unknown protein [uncultured Sulfurovum sp.]
MKIQIIALIGLATFLSADPTVDEVLSNKEIESFFYNKGLQDGIAKGRKQGAKEAYKKAKKSLEKYANKMKANEVGKYLYKEQKITPPRLYQRQDEDGKISVVIEGCKLEQQLSPSEILALPKYGGNETPYQPTQRTSAPKRTIMSDNVYLPGVDDDISKPTLSGSDAEIAYREYEDTEFHRQLFRVSGKPYAVVSNGSLKVIFNSSEEAHKFNLRYKISSVN